MPQLSRLEEMSEMLRFFVGACCTGVRYEVLWLHPFATVTDGVGDTHATLYETPNISDIDFGSKSLAVKTFAEAEVSPVELVAIS